MAFRSPESLNALSCITGPGIKNLLLENFSILEHDKKYDIVAVEGAILVESNTYKFFDELWVLKLDKPTAFSRVKKRNPNLSDVEI